MSLALVQPTLKAAVPPALYTADDIAQLLQCSTRNIWKLSDAGVLPGLTRIGRLVRWRAKDVNEWISSGCPKPKGI
jgi:excisionase family DNA binding protein